MIKKNTVKPIKITKKAKSKPKRSSQKISIKNNNFLVNKIGAISAYRNNFLARRPHRSFQRTRRRDYIRPLELPSYTKFSLIVTSHLRKNWKVFTSLTLLYALLTGLFVGLASQSNYQELAGVLNETTQDAFTGGWGEVGKAGLLLVSGVSGSFNSVSTEAQQLYAFLLFMMIWLTTIWLLRAQVAGDSPRLRDGLYSSGAPLFSSIAIGVLFLIQMAPAALGVLLYVTANSFGFLELGALSMIAALVSLLLILLSAYLLTSSLFALVIVTLPGMYPWRAIKIAGDLVVGRRLKLLLRVIWGAVLVATLWFIVMLPIFLLVSLLQSKVEFIAAWPVIPLSLLIVSSGATVLFSTYIYFLYRKVVDDDSAPA